MEFKHIPVMPLEAVDALSVRSGGIYIDGTLGGGGHSAIILERLQGKGRLIGIDQDIDAINAAKIRFGLSDLAINNPVRQGELITLVHSNFHNLPQILHDHHLEKIDGILLDLGVSSHQLDTPKRGFSYRHEGKLDMRMNRESDLTAYDIVNTYTEAQLTDILFTLGEERFARRIAKGIVSARQNAPIETTLQLSEIIESSTPRRKNDGPHPAMRSFMALRIAVNNELHPLDTALEQMVDCLNPGGRICVITFHSLEDRIVKQCFNRLQNPCACPRDIPYCVCGKMPGLKVLTKKPILPSLEELTQNSRAHSAKLRVGEKLYENPATPPKKGQ